MKRIIGLALSLVLVGGVAYALTSDDVSELERIRVRAQVIQMLNAGLSADVAAADAAAIDEAARLIENITDLYLSTPSSPPRRTAFLTLDDTSALERIRVRAQVIQNMSARLSDDVSGEDAVALTEAAARIEGMATGYLAPSPSPEPTPTPPPPGDVVRIAAAGDIATGGDGDTKTSDLVRALSPDQVYTLGDNVYPEGTGTVAPFEALYAPTWGRFASLTFPTVGNHDYYGGGPGGYLAYFGRPLQYSHVAGNWLIVHLDSQGPSATALIFLRSTLEADDHLCEMVLWHHPRYSSGDHGNDAKQSDIWDESVAQGVDVVLNGHDHNYERFAPKGGTRGFVVGTGGVDTRGFSSPQPGSEIRLTGNDNWGVIDMDLAAAGYTWEFRRATGGIGTVADSGAEACHA